MVNGNKSSHQGKFYSGKINFTIDNYVWIRDPVFKSDLSMGIRKPSMANFSYIECIAFLAIIVIFMETYWAYLLDVEESIKKL